MARLYPGDDDSGVSEEVVSADPAAGAGRVPGKPGGIWGCILSELKEYTPRPPKKNSGGVSIPPPDPSYDQRKGCGPSFGNHPEEYGGFRYEGRWDGGRESGAECSRSFRGFRLVGDEGGEGLVVLAPGLGGYCPARGRGRHAGVVVPYGWVRKVSSTTLGRVRRRSRFAARRIVEAADRSWQRNGGLRPRPPSSGNSKKGPGPLLGFRRSRRKE